MLSHLNSYLRINRLVIFAGYSAIALIAANCIWGPPENLELRKNIAQHIGLVKTKPIGDTLTIDVGNLTRFSWDTLYVFTGPCPADKVSAATGVSWHNGDVSGWLDAAPDNLFVFMYGGEVVTNVWYRGYGDDEQPDFIHFQSHWGTGELFTPTTAVFSVWRSKFKPDVIQLGVKRNRPPSYRPHFDRKMLYQY